MDKRKAYETLTKLSAELLRGCEKTAPDGTVLFTPDGVGNYDALWVRDFAYMTEYVGDLMGEKAIGLHSVYPARAACGRVVPRPRGGERRNRLCGGREGFACWAGEFGQHTVSRFCGIGVF